MAWPGEDQETTDSINSRYQRDAERSVRVFVVVGVVCVMLLIVAVVLGVTGHS
jgi:hypothetical protein